MIYGGIICCDNKHDELFDCNIDVLTYFLHFVPPKISSLEERLAMPRSCQPLNSRSPLWHWCRRSCNLRRLSLCLLQLGLGDFRCLTVEDNFRLLEVAAGIFVNKDKREIIASGVFLIDLAEGWGKFEAAEEEADWDCFTARG